MQLVTNHAPHILINGANPLINWNAGDMIGAFYQNEWKNAWSGTSPR